MRRFAFAVLLAQIGMIALAPGGGGAYTSLELPGTVARQLLVPAVIALFFRFVRAPTWPVALTLAAAGMDLAFVHPTYALFVVMPLLGFALVRTLAGSDTRRSAAGVERINTRAPTVDPSSTPNITGMVSPGSM